MSVTVSLRRFIGLIAYPPGTIYTCASNIDPAEMWGGEWEKLTGTFLWAADEERPMGSTGGEKTHTLTVSEIPSHSHGFSVRGNALSTAWRVDFQSVAGQNYSTNKAGGDQPHNNMPPYLSVNMWKRLTAFSSGGGVHPNPLKSLFQRRCLLWHCL